MSKLRHRIVQAEGYFDKCRYLNHGGDTEWQTLETYLSPDAGLKMKSASGWNNGGNGDNTSGFSGLPGGVRNGSGTFGLVGYYGYWWNSSQYFQYSAWGHGLYYLSDYVDKSLNNKESGMSVRCLRD